MNVNRLKQFFGVPQTTYVLVTETRPEWQWLFGPFVNQRLAEAWCLSRSDSSCYDLLDKKSFEVYRSSGVHFLARVEDAPLFQVVVHPKGSWSTISQQIQAPTVDKAASIVAKQLPCRIDVYHKSELIYKEYRP